MGEWERENAFKLETARFEQKDILQLGAVHA